MLVCSLEHKSAPPLKKYMKVSKINQVSKNSNGNIMVKNCQKFPNRGGVQKNQQCPKFKNFPSKGGGGSQNLGTVPKLYLVINYEGFPRWALCEHLTSPFHEFP